MSYVLDLQDIVGHFIFRIKLSFRVLNWSSVLSGVQNRIELFPLYWVTQF